jgi:DNA-binding IclR family transcriptional regulator
MLAEKKVRKKYEVVTVSKVFEILQAVAEVQPNPGISLAELSRKLGASKSTLSRYLQTLEGINVVERNDWNRYQLGWAMVEITGAYLSNLDLPNLARPSMLELSELTKETVHLAVPSGTEMVYIGKVEGPQSVRMAAQIGTRMPMYCTSLGKSALAFMPSKVVDEVVHTGLPPRTPNTIISPEALLRNLEEIRVCGYAVDNVENEVGVRCIGAPLFDYAGRVVGAISVSGPTSRVTPEDVAALGPMVKETAWLISRRMGYRR